MDRITRTCSVSLALAALALAGTPADAKRNDRMARSALANYVQARVAGVEGASGAAIAAYAAALTADPANELVALRAYRQALAAGDRRLALRAASTLSASKVLPGDGQLLLFTEALRTGDWARAATGLDRIEGDGGFDFLVPVLRAWVAFGAREGDAVALLDRRGRSVSSAGYSGEQRALLLLASRQVEDGMAAVKAQAGSNALEPAGLRLAAAAQLVALGKRAEALTLLDGDATIIAEARERVKAGKPLPGAVAAPSAGAAALFARVSGDLLRDRVAPAGLTLARLASFLAPEDDAIKLAVARALVANGDDASALATLRAVPASSLYAGSARDASVDILRRDGQNDAALALAKTGAAGGAMIDLIRLGDLYTLLDRDAEAADAYGRAVAATAARQGEAAVPWNLYLLHGGALEQAGRWDEARPILERAAKMAPDEPAVLNHLGYALLVRNGDLAEAERLIARASTLRPDDPAITDSLGWVQYHRGDLKRAIPTLERAVAGEPTEPEIGEHLGDAYWRAGRKIDARYAWNAALIQAGEADAARLRVKIDTGLPVAR